LEETTIFLGEKLGGCDELGGPWGKKSMLEISLSWKVSRGGSLSFQACSIPLK